MAYRRQHRERVSCYFLMCCVLSCFSHAWLLVTPWTVFHQAPLYWSLFIVRAPQMALVVKSLPANEGPQEMWVSSLDWADPLEQEMATRTSILAWRIPWTEEPGRLPSMRPQRVGHDWAHTHTHTHTHIGTRYQIANICRVIEKENSKKHLLLLHWLY